MWWNDWSYEERAIMHCRAIYLWSERRIQSARRSYLSNWCCQINCWITVSPGIGTSKDVRFIGLNFGTIIRNKLHNLNLHLSKCDWPRVGWGIKYEQRNQESSSFDTKIRAYCPLFHGMMYCFNVCASQSVNVASIRNCIDAVREIIGFVGFRTPRNHILQKTIRKITGTVPAWRNCDTRFIE